jgi:cytochrome oxidase Cu insertion factor (SCO1/SenC/PrrC family)
VNIARKILAACRRFFTGVGLPAFILAGLLVYEVFLLAVIFAPADSGIWSRFSVEFKVWCFSYDPVAGRMENGLAWIMALEPFLLGGIIFGLFRRDLRQGWSPVGRRRMAMAAASGAMFSALVMAGLVVYGQPTEGAVAELPPFPGERIRTHMEAPPIKLVDHKGKTVELADLRGRVVLITGVYAFCSTSCPQILRQVKDLFEWLPEKDRAGFATLALSLNPEYDTPEYMDAIAGAFGFPYPGFHYLNGEAGPLRNLLTDLQFSPQRNATTGAIDHANLFILVDASGKIAYRFNLDPRHEGWIKEALAQLLQEAADDTGAVAVGQ